VTLTSLVALNSLPSDSTIAITLQVFAGFIILLGTGLGVIGWIAGILPFLLVVILFALEALVAFLQAYVFAILTCIYMNDAIHPGH